MDSLLILLKNNIIFASRKTIIFQQNNPIYYYYYWPQWTLAPGPISQKGLSIPSLLDASILITFPFLPLLQPSSFVTIFGHNSIPPTQTMHRPSGN
jgi:hypothetical protein